MTRPLTLCAFFLFALAFGACKDVPIGGDGVNPRRDGSPDLTPTDQAPGVLPDQAPDKAPDLGPEVATCTGANPAAQTCRKTANDCIPSSCTCTDGSWHCTADCPVNVPLCADGGSPDQAPDLAPDQAPDQAPDKAPDTATCSGSNPSAPTCRKTANDCIPSTCYCGGDGTWTCSADCRTSLPLCTDGGTSDLTPDLGNGRPTDEQSCIKATNVPGCDISRPYALVTRAPGGPLLSRVEVTSGPCEPSGASSSGSDSLGILGNSSATAGTACVLRAVSMDERSQTFVLSVEATPTDYTCCGYPVDGHGVWTKPTILKFTPSAVVIDFVGDGGAFAGELGSEVGSNPCAKCTGTEVCVQAFDGMCGGRDVTCKPASEACRTKLAASGTKNCKAIPECESEFCLTPSYRCVYDPPCGTEAPEAQVYCYGI